MSEFDYDNIEIDIKNRNFSIKKSDFKLNKKEQFLFDYFTDNPQNKFFKSDSKSVSIGLLDQEIGTKGTITKQDIQIFLRDKKVQKNKITQDDVISFLEKMKKLNPTKEEQAQANITEKYKDESGATVMTPELKKLFGLEYKDVNASDFFDKDKNIKKGMEVFDLNGDGKIDKIENIFLNNVIGYRLLSNLDTTLDKLEKANSPDGKITKEDKLAMYRRIAQEKSQREQEELNKTNITDEHGNNIITDKVKALFANGKDSISFDEIIDQSQNGKIKSGFEIFDLNGDGKLDETEKAYFSNNGHYSNNSNERLELESFLNAVTNLDNVGYEKEQYGHKGNNIIPTADKTRLYKMLSSGKYMLENIKTFPENLQKQYVEVLNKTSLYDHKAIDSVGVSRGDYIAVDSDSLSEPEIASVMVHEFAHSILGDKMPLLLQEVVTFYTEYRLYSEATKNDSDYFKKIQSSDSGIKTIAVDMDYMNFIDNLRKENPNMSEKDLAIEAFLKFQFNTYNGRYQENVSEDFIRNANYDIAKDFFEK